MKMKKLTLDSLHLEFEILKTESLNCIKGGGVPLTITPVTDYLTAFFGQQVVSSTDAMGNWVISIGNSDPIPLAFQLNDVAITASGKITDKNSGVELYGGWGDWLGSNYTGYVSTGTGNVGGGSHGGGNQPPLPVGNSIIIQDNVHPTFETNVYGPLTVSKFRIDGSESYDFFGNMKQLEQANQLVIGAIEAPYLATQLYALATFYMGSTWQDMQDTIVHADYKGAIFVEKLETVSMTGIHTQYIIRTEDGTILGTSSI